MPRTWEQGVARVPFHGAVLRRYPWRSAGAGRLVAVAREAARAEGRRETLPVVVFLSVMMAVFGLAFVLENLRPRSSPAEEVLAEPVLTSARRSA